MRPSSLGTGAVWSDPKVRIIHFGSPAITQEEREAESFLLSPKGEPITYPVEGKRVGWSHG